LTTQLAPRAAARPVRGLSNRRCCRKNKDSNADQPAEMASHGGVSQMDQGAEVPKHTTQHAPQRGKSSNPYLKRRLRKANNRRISRNGGPSDVWTHRPADAGPLARRTAAELSRRFPSLTHRASTTRAGCPRSESIWLGREPA